MITPEGQPFVPPTCPIERKDFIEDLMNAEFHYAADSMPLKTPSGRVLTTDVSMGFETEYDSNIVLEPDCLLLPYEDKVAYKAREIMDAIEPGDTISVAEPGKEIHPILSSLRERMCERIVNCHGVIDGECWALGATAFKAMLLETDTDF